jgi:hypothetical protein
MRTRVGVIWVAVGVAALAAFGWMPGASEAAKTGSVPQDRNCFYQLARGTNPELICDYPAFLTEDERTSLKSLTRDLVQDASCLVAVRIDRQLVDLALAADDHEFVAPPQRVTCNIQTKDSVMPVSATFSPRVVIRGGKAVDATPGLGNVQGVAGALSWPLVEFVNRSPLFRDGMVRNINAYLARNR